MRVMGQRTARGDQLSVQNVRGFALFLAASVLALHWMPGSDPELLTYRLLMTAGLCVFATATWVSEGVQRHAEQLLHVLAYALGAGMIMLVARDAFTPERSLMLFVSIAVLGLLFLRARSLLLFYLAQVSFVGVSLFLTPDPVVNPYVIVGGLALLTAASSIIAVHRTRTVRHLAELSTVAEKVNAGLALVTQDGSIRWSNERLVSLLGDGDPQGTLKDRSLLALLGAEDSVLAGALTERKLAESDRYHGSQWLSVRLIPLHTAPNRTIAVIDDVTPRRATVERILSVVNDALLVVDGRGQIQSANPAAETLLGASSDHMVGEPLVTFLADGSEEAGHRLLFEVGGPDSRPQNRVLHFSDQSGESISVNVSAAALPVRPGEDPSTLLVIRDTRPQRDLERQQQALEARLQRAQRLESLEALAGRVAHDANNLLVSVMGHAELAAMQTADLSATGRLEQIQQAAEQAANLNGQLLALAGRTGASAQAVNLSVLTEEAGSLLLTALAPEATLRLDLDDQLPLITGYPHKLQQALLNLARNASEALEGNDGTITIRTRDTHTTEPTPITVEEPLKPGRYALLEIEDTGTGISADIAEKIFDPGFSSRAPDRGLGLAATLGIVRNHGGSLVVSTSQQGTRMQVWFPIAPIAQPTIIEPVSRSVGPGTILLVDDDDDVRDIVREALERAGYTVLTAQNGVQCLRAFAAERGRIRVVLLDLNMPGMRGEEILRRLHAAAPEVPVIITSGYAPHHIEGATAIIHKPYRLRDLISTVQKVVPSD